MQKLQEHVADAVFPKKANVIEIYADCERVGNHYEAVLTHKGLILRIGEVERTPLEAPHEDWDSVVFRHTFEKSYKVSMITKSIIKFYTGSNNPVKRIKHFRMVMLEKR